MSRHATALITLGALALAAACGDNLAARVDGGPTPPKPDASVRPPRPELGEMIDRMGRPLTEQLLIGPLLVEADKREIRERYERADQLGWRVFESEIQANLGMFDALDSQVTPGDGCANLQLPYRDLAQLLADDQLFVDTTLGVCSQYFSVERSFLRRENRATCGGRAPSYDAVDTIYSEVIKGLGLPAVSDGVSPHLDHNDEAFPFLGPPHP